MFHQMVRRGTLQRRFPLGEVQARVTRETEKSQRQACLEAGGVVQGGRESTEKGEWEGAAGSPQVFRQPLLSTSRNSERLEYSATLKCDI